MKNLDRMSYVNIIDKTYEALKGKEVTYENIKSSFKEEKNFNTLRTFLSIYSKGVFRVYYKDHNPEHIKKVMEFRREFFLSEPTDDTEEYNELLQYFEEQEDYETCSKLKKNKIVA